MLKTTPEKLPVRLGKSPILEALFEIRFAPARDDIGQLLPGVLISALGKRYPRSESLPIASIPEAIRRKDPGLQHQYIFRISGDEGVISIGDRSAAVAALPSYPGWSVFSSRIDEFLDAVNKSGLIPTVERFSIKYVNVIEATSGTQLESLNLALKAGGVGISDRGFNLRFEMNDDRFQRIVEVTPNATAVHGTGNKRSGLLLSIDVIRPLGNQPLSAVTAAEIGGSHLDAKKIFFGLIAGHTLQSLEPIYE